MTCVLRVCLDEMPMISSAMRFLAASMVIAMKLAAFHGPANHEKSEIMFLESIDAVRQTPAVVERLISLRKSEDYLDWNAARINNQLPFYTSTRSIYQIMGRPDSTVHPNLDEICVSFYEKEFRYEYFNGVEAEIYGDTAVITSLDFRNNDDLSVSSTNITLNSRTTLSEMTRIYPNAVKGKREIDVHHFGRATVITLNISRQPSDDLWMLVFKDGKLARLDYWMPC